LFNFSTKKHQNLWVLLLLRNIALLDYRRCSFANKLEIII